MAASLPTNNKYSNYSVHATKNYGLEPSVSMQELVLKYIHRVLSQKCIRGVH